MTHYPIESAPIATDSTSSSSLHLESSRRKVNSDDTSTTLQSGEKTRRTSRHSADQIKKRIGETKNRKHPSSNCSSSCADSRHPIIDISDLDYRAYRHKLIEATLKKQYDDFQPPGDVVLNSLHLNTADSVVGVRLNDQYEHSLFDFVEEYYDVTKVRNRRNDKRLHPLDYFLTRGERRPRTSEKETETIENITWKDSSDRESIGNHHPSESVNLLKVPNNSVDDNGNLRVYSPARSISFDDSIGSAITRNDLNSRSGPPRDKTTISSFRANETENRYSAGNECPRSSDSGARIGASWTTTRNRPSSAGSASTTPKAAFALSRAATLPERKSVTKLSRPSTSAGFTPKKSENRPGGFPNERRETETEEPDSNLISASSSEIVSICCSDSSSRQREDETSFRSRESSISPRSRVSRPPWMSGCRGTSFNRKYGNITRGSAAKSARPTSAHGGSGLSTSSKLTVSKRGRSNECFPAAASLSRNPTSPERERGAPASFTATRVRELIETSAEQRRRDKNLPISLCQQRDKLKDLVERVAAEGNEDEETLRIADSSGKRASAISADTVAASFLSSTRRIQPRADSSDAPAAASVAVSRTSATKETRLTSRSGDDARKTLLPSVQNQRGNSAKLNRDGRRQLKSAENPSRGGAASPSSKIELPARVLNPTDDTDKSAITPVEKRLAGRAIDPRKRNARRAAESNTKFNDVAQPKVQKSKIVENLKRRPTSANSVLGKGPMTARRNANSETKSGFNSAKLNSRSNGAIDGKTSSSVVEKTKETRGQDVAARASGEELKLPQRDSKVGLAMNSALKRYIKTLKQALLNKSDKNGVVALASLSLGDAISILSEQKTPLSPEEIQELQSVLDKVEKHPELLCKESPLDVENV